MSKSKPKSSGSKAGAAGVAAGMAARGFTYARKVNWPVLWARAQWLAYHTRRLYENLDEAERKEFMRLVVPMKDARTAKNRLSSSRDRTRLQELVKKAFLGDSTH